MIDLNKLKELAAKASPGPWHIGHVNEHEDSADIDNLEECLFVSVLRRDQAFICEARNALPKLIELVEAYEEQLNIRAKRSHYQWGEGSFGSYKDKDLMREGAVTAMNVLVSEFRAQRKEILGE